jgi:hypothetical protein
MHGASAAVPGNNTAGEQGPVSGLLPIEQQTKNPTLIIGRSWSECDPTFRITSKPDSRVEGWPTRAGVSESRTFPSRLRSIPLAAKCHDHARR